MAALIVAVATLVGCTKENIGNGNGLTFTTTVEMPANGTKALDANGHKTFAEGERIKLTYDGGLTIKSERLGSTDISADGHAAKFTFNFPSEPTLAAGSAIKYEYPGSWYGDLTGQVGTLARVEEMYDYAKCETTVSVAGKLPTNITLDNQYAILKLKILNSVGTDITSSITHFKFTGGGNTVTVSRPGVAGPFYVVVPDVASGNIEFEAGEKWSRNDEEPYYKRTKTVSGKTLARGHLYPVELTMGPATVTWNDAVFEEIEIYGYENTDPYGGIQVMINGDDGQWEWNNVECSSPSSTAVSFISSVGDITRIVITDIEICNGDLGEGWSINGTTATWSGTSDVVNLFSDEQSGECQLYFNGTITFTVK